jgi:hypothetical protein
MPVAPAALLAIQSASAISQVASGIGGMGAATQESELEKQQGEIALNESQINANNAAYNYTQQVQGQRVGFLASGVSLEGSPTLVLAASKSYAQTQVQSILNEGAAKYNLAQEEAANTINKGRAGIISGIMQGISTEASAAQKFTLSQNTQANAMTLAAGTAPSITSMFSTKTF